MLFLQVFTSFSQNLGGFSQQHQGNQNRIPRKILWVFVENASNFVTTDAITSRKQIVSECWNFFGGSFFACNLLKNAIFITFHIYSEITSDLTVPSFFNSFFRS